MDEAMEAVAAAAGAAAAAAETFCPQHNRKPNQGLNLDLTVPAFSLSLSLSRLIVRRASFTVSSLRQCERRASSATK